MSISMILKFKAKFAGSIIESHGRRHYNEPSAAHIVERQLERAHLTAVLLV